MVQNQGASTGEGEDLDLPAPGTLPLTTASGRHETCATFRATVGSGSKEVCVDTWWCSVAFGGQPREGCGWPHGHPLRLGHLGCIQLSSCDAPIQVDKRRKTCNRTLPLTIPW